MNYKFAYVLLHYNTLKDTLLCVNSIGGGKINQQIIIVDNKSPNGSGIELFHKFRDNPNVHVILNPHNDGFTGGNNIGFRYAKEKLDADFIVMLNNDTIIEQTNFEDLVVEEYQQSGFAVLGPRIENPGQVFSSNPVSYKESSVCHYAWQFVKSLLNLVRVCLYVENLYQRTKRKIITRRDAAASVGRYDNERRENVMLHGCFWVFSRKYIDLFDGLNHQTFLYGEEPMLYHRLLINDLKSVYQPSIHVFHKEDASTKTIKQNNRKRQLFINRYVLLANLAVIRNRFTEKRVNQQIHIKE